jgi:multicomponent Na+:H+ antiporter subunit F
MLQDFMLFVILPMMGVSIVFALMRLVKRKTSTADRVLALDLITTLGIGIIVAYAVAVGQPTFLDIAVVLALLGFLTTVAFALYIEQSGEVEDVEPDT